MPSLHAVSEHVKHIPCPHYMQFRSLHDICHATIICHCGVLMGYAMLSLSANSELLKHMQCPQLLLYIALYYFILLYITLSYIGLYCTLSLISPMGPKPCRLQNIYHALITSGSGAWIGICCTVLLCSVGAYEEYVMPS